jgi:tripartite-type tricarboxylate transporter receptor subunit TctC
VIDLVGGQVQFFFMNPLVAVPNVKSGKLKALAVTTLERNSALPDVPTIHETVLPNFQSITWHSVLVPAGTPKPIVQRLNSELVKIVNSPDVKDRFTQQGLTAVGSSPEELRALIKTESAEYAKVVKEIGLQPQ